MKVQNIMNWLIFGNIKGIPTHKGKSTSEYNDFLKSVFHKECIGCNKTENLEKCDGAMCRTCWEEDIRDDK